MRIVLLRTPWHLPPEEVIQPPEPLSLEYLAAMLRGRHEVTVLDGLLDEKWLLGPLPLAGMCEEGLVRVGCSIEEIQGVIASEKPDVVGITAPFFSQDRPLKEVCRGIKEILPDSVIIVGGSYPSSLGKAFLSHNPDVDIAVIGEGEVTMAELLDSCLGDLASIAGIAFRNGDQIISTPPRSVVRDLDTLPFPARDLFPYDEYIMRQRPLYRNHPVAGVILKVPGIAPLYDCISNKLNLYRGGHHQLPSAQVITSRGCPLNCNFCVVHHVWGHAVRLRNVDSIIAEIIGLMRRYGVRHIEFVDDNFNISKKRVIELCRRLEPLGITWRPSSGIFVPAIDREVLTWMKRSGCSYITIAIESGNARTLKNIIGKNVDFVHLSEVLEACRELGIFTEGFFILGIPGETKRDMAETVRFAATCGVDRGRLYIATPFPGSRMYDECMRNGYIPPVDDFSTLQVTLRKGNTRASRISTPDFSAADVLRIRDIGYKILEEKNYERYRAELEAI